jgi:uncharacterized protein (TIGR03083 family)
MPMNPTAPQGLHDLVEAFAQTSESILELARACSGDDLGQPTECPGWTVHDQIAHVVGVEAWLGGHKDPRVAMPHYEHIRNDLGKKVEYAVEVRRANTGAQLVAELERVLAQRLSTLRSSDLTDASIIAGPFGPEAAATVMMLRTFDVWTHEQDIRTAIRRPGNLGSPAAAVFVATVIGQLPRLIAKGAAVEPGHPVVIDVTSSDSAVAARECVMVTADDQGRLRGQLISADSSPGRGTTISLSTEAFTRRAAGRRSVSDTAYGVVGDEAIARRVVEALVVTH